MLFDCQFEAEVLEAVSQSRWPGRVDAELCAHVAECPICSDVVAIAGAFDQARDEMRADTIVPDASRVWRLAQIRARRDALGTAGRPITAAQFIAFACAIGPLAATWDEASPLFQSALASATAVAAEHGAMLLAMAAVVFLLPAAVYLALGRD